MHTLNILMCMTVHSSCTPGIYIDIHAHIALMCMSVKIPHKNIDMHASINLKCMYAHCTSTPEICTCSHCPNVHVYAMYMYSRN